MTKERNNHSLCYNVIFNTQKLGLKLTTTKTKTKTCKDGIIGGGVRSISRTSKNDGILGVVVKVTNNEHKNKIFPGDVLIFVGKTKLKNNVSSMKDIVKIINSYSIRPLTIRFGRRRKRKDHYNQQQQGDEIHALPHSGIFGRAYGDIVSMVKYDNRSATITRTTTSEFPICTSTTSIFLGAHGEVKNSKSNESTTQLDKNLCMGREILVESDTNIDNDDDDDITLNKSRYDDDTTALDTAAKKNVFEAELEYVANTNATDTAFRNEAVQNAYAFLIDIKRELGNKAYIKLTAILKKISNNEIDLHDTVSIISRFFRSGNNNNNRTLKLGLFDYLSSHFKVSVEELMNIDDTAVEQEQKFTPKKRKNDDCGSQQYIVVEERILVNQNDVGNNEQLQTKTIPTMIPTTKNSKTASISTTCVEIADALATATATASTSTIASLVVATNSLPPSPPPPPPPLYNRTHALRAIGVSCTVANTSILAIKSTTAITTTCAKSSNGLKSKTKKKISAKGDNNDIDDESNSNNTNDDKRKCVYCGLKKSMSIIANHQRYCMTIIDRATKRKTLEAELDYVDNGISAKQNEENSTLPKPISASTIVNPQFGITKKSKDQMNSILGRTVIDLLSDDEDENEDEDENKDENKNEDEDENENENKDKAEHLKLQISLHFETPEPSLTDTTYVEHRTDTINQTSLIKNKDNTKQNSSPNDKRKNNLKKQQEDTSPSFVIDLLEEGEENEEDQLVLKPQVSSIDKGKDEKEGKNLEDDGLVIIGSTAEPIDIDLLEVESGHKLSQPFGLLEDDDEIQITGSTGKNALSDFPHARHLCLVKPHTKNQEEFCPNCYCYICDIKASECSEWQDFHCKADSNSKWKRRRSKIRNKRKAPERALQRLAYTFQGPKTNNDTLSTSHVSSRTRTRRRNTSNTNNT